MKEGKELFAAAGLTKRAFADEMDLHPGTVYQWKVLPTYARKYLLLLIRHRNLMANFEILRQKLEGVVLENEKNG